MKYKTTNPDLKIIKEGWVENPLDRKGRYQNMPYNKMRTFKDIFKWKFTQTNPYKEEKKSQFTNVEVLKNTDFLSAKDSITWLGHATFLIETAGKKIIIDPVFYNLGPLKRYTDLPCDPKQITNLDHILLSHAHRDHLDRKSFQLICDLNPQATILTGLQVGDIIKDMGIKNPIVEGGWYQRLLDTDIVIDYLPAKHWNRRWLTDLNTVLWGGFMIKSKDTTIYFGGDSGKGDHFSEIADLYPTIDVAILGIGAYAPVWFMCDSHTSPSDVAEITQTINANTLIPMHYGTYDLSDEPVHNPKQEITKLADAGKIASDLQLLDIGRSWSFC